jgi:hypothetical protein
MDALLQSRAQELATEFAGQATTVDGGDRIREYPARTGKIQVEQPISAQNPTHFFCRTACSTINLPLPSSNAGRCGNYGL